MNRPQPAPTGRRGRPRGIALLMALSVVMLLTFFMSEYFFATGLELRGMTTFKEAQQSRMLARSVFKAVQVAMLQDEVAFFQGYGQLSALLTGGGAVPWNDGLLLVLEVVPQDHLFNLNQNYRARPGEAQDRARSRIFLQTLQGIQVPDPNLPGIEEPLSPETIVSLYAAFSDWIDTDSDEYLEYAAVRGAERSAYINQDPPYEIKNGMLDRLEEIRLVRGVMASHVPWRTWEQTLTALPYVSEGSYFTERINVNVASYEQIAKFLGARLIDPNEVGADQEMIKGIDGYAERADELAKFFAPTDTPRETYDPGTLKTALEGLGFDDKYGVNFLFSTVNQYYRIRIVTEVAQVRTRLEAMIQIPRDDKTRIAKGKPKVMWETVN